MSISFEFGPVESTQTASLLLPRSVFVAVLCASEFALLLSLHPTMTIEQIETPETKAATVPRCEMVTAGDDSGAMG